jgi:hypothetical protein
MFESEYGAERQSNIGIELTPWVPLWNEMLSRLIDPVILMRWRSSTHRYTASKNVANHLIHELATKHLLGGMK